MFDDAPKPKFDPRSPVQHPRSPAPYLIVAALAAILVWTAEQYWSADFGSGHSVASGQQSPQSTTRSPTGDVRTIFTADDYPASAQRNGEEGTVQARLTINQQGLVSACDVIRSSGHETLDRATCTILQKRARFTPARDRNGDSISSTVITPPVKWQLQG